MTNLFFGPHIFSFDWSRLPSSYMTAVALSWLTRNDQLHRGRHCILVMWYTINGKLRCFLGVPFMFLPESCISIFWWYCRGRCKILYQLLKILRLFPSPNLGWACLWNNLCSQWRFLIYRRLGNYAEHLKMATKSLDSDTVWVCIVLLKACIAK